MAPGGRSPATYRFMEYLVIGVIPIIIQDTPELIPLEGYIDFSNCALYTLTSQLEHLVTKLRSMTPEEINSRQIECSFIYETYFRGNPFLLLSYSVLFIILIFLLIDYATYFDTLVKATLHTYKKTY
jgi:hypothetical protein